MISVLELKMKLKTLWYLSEFGTFLLYWVLFYIISSKWLLGFMIAVALTILTHIVRFTLSKIKIEEE